MLTCINKLFRQLFPDNSYGSSLERFILNNNPKTISDIEHLEKRFYFENSRSIL